MDKTVFLGITRTNMLVFANVRILPASDRVVEFVDHTTGTEPESIAMSFSLVANNSQTRGKKLARIADRFWWSGGQIPADERVLRFASDAVRVVEDAWKTTHLNLLNAACVHMTDEMLNPSEATLREYGFQHPRVPDYSTLQYWRLDTVVCPESGYRYGTKWLARTVSADVIRQLRSAVDALPEVSPR